jgi:transcription initiation factor TFIID subunit 2
VPKPNDFADISEYLVRKVIKILSQFLLLSFSQFQSLVAAISQVRFENGKTPSVVRQFLIDQLRYNDNTSNPVGVSK